MSAISLDLTGVWEFKEYPLSARRMRDLDSPQDACRRDNWQKANVPSSIFNSLIAAGQVKQDEINTNPQDFAWVSEKPWVYRKVFDASSELLNCDRIDVVFEGLDTIASIWLNEKLIARTNNMFTPFRFDVTELIKPRNNSLVVKFEPAVLYAKRLMDRYTKFSESDFINPHRIYIRKAQYQFGWDFCPQLPGCGIFRPVRLEGVKYARIADLNIRTVDCNHKYADIKIAVKLDIVTKGQFCCRITLPADRRTMDCGDETIEQNLFFKPDEDCHSTVVRIENPSLWWPAGYGKQNLYNIDARLYPHGAGKSSQQVIDQVQKSFGIRTLKLNRSPDKDSAGRLPAGESFRFEINGQPLFAMGANWIPASIFAGSVTNDDYQKLLRSAAEANINMLRVWGGGYYEADEFYQLCDKLGIMVWQDFMFACAYYPDKKWFTEQVKAEAVAIIKRLRNHPCLALWCGNNEIDWMHATGKFGKGKKFYGKAIYHKLLPQLVAELDPDTEYIPTTPLAAVKNANDPNSGTVHQWDVWSGHQPVRNYLVPAQNIPRFVTEFGLQSLPNIATVKKFCPADQLHIGSLPIEKHNYQEHGNSRLYRYTGDLFGTAKNVEQFVYLSQITQARAVKTYVEYLRAHSHRNAGLLFWQFNDCCPAISWSAVDYTKQPKAVYYYAKRFFSKLLIVAVPQLDQVKSGSGPISVVVINGADNPLTATLNCRLIDLFGNLIDQVAFPVATAPFSTSSVTKLPRAISFPDAPQESCLHLVMDRDGQKIAENLFFYLPDKYVDWPEPEITSRLSKIAGGHYRLELKSNAVAKDVQICCAAPAQFSDNFIDLVPPDVCRITVNSQQQIPLLESSIQIRSVKSVF